ncbi:PREDICTED: sigma non-opioid intracellular receptor 1 [Nelumbo nucifera]|uniref:Sigma non-opioid intracellular receptor 1 n=2 Tax=Nelumbo nucifera TaxID=4432 RepID=A0A1U7ZX37_NELNU|nr:PREDICTED: sigma non-opioid intracellular receptor 1 [Nelumbo nucifera]DAD47884.1 TPA_asm: hypothetical protein HUJ06_017821 [Nelumbo nucifera]
MKTVVLPASSARSTTTTVEDWSETRDNCYFPGCRKDANCNCEICLASINATLDLMPMSVQRSSFTKLSASKQALERTPVSFDPSILFTPKSSIHQTPITPPLKSTAKLSSLEKIEKKRKRPWAIEFKFWRFLVGLSLILASDIGFAWVVSGLFKPELSAETVRTIAGESRILKQMNLRLEFLEKRLGDIAHGKVSNCSSAGSTWEFNQDGLLLNSRCILYKSASEEISIWGWPLRTAGLLATGFSSRSLTILSGKITEWSEGKFGFSVGKTNSSWVQKRWSASVVQLDPNTWVLEYRQSTMLENPRLILSVLEFVKFGISRTIREMKHQFWMLPSFSHHYRNTAGDNCSRPT